MSPIQTESLPVWVGGFEAADSFLKEMKEVGWQLTRVGDEERLRAVVDAARVVADEMVQQGGGDRWWEAIAALTKAIDFLAPQPPSPASQGEER